jgi:hypothetical protein
MNLADKTPEDYLREQQETKTPVDDVMELEELLIPWRMRTQYILLNHPLFDEFFSNREEEENEQSRN